MIIFCSIKYKDEEQPRVYSGLSTDLSFHERYTYNLKTASLRNLNVANSLNVLLGDFHKIEYIIFSMDTIDNVIKTYQPSDIVDLSLMFNMGGPSATAVDEQLDIQLKLEN